jgi:hypothetical protein
VRRAALALVVVAACQGPPADGEAPRDAGPADAAIDARPQPDAGLPDLVVDLDRARSDLAIERRTYAVDSCELDPDEDCVDAAGERRLLRFSVETPNLGDGDLVLGPPQLGNDRFAYSACHMHYHFEGYAVYRLRDAASKLVATGRKQAFCLLDTDRYVDEDGVATGRRYDCDFQGIQRGWSDVYDSKLPCQGIDVTDVPDGDYTLEIELNHDGALPELSLANNLVAIPVTLGDDDLARPDEPCPSDLGARASDGKNRECGWTDLGRFACTPGAQLHVGCAAGCLTGGLGSCTGDPMLRVCDADRADGNCSFAGALGDSDNVPCGGSCPVATGIACPASGELAVFAAPHHVGDAFVCDVEVRAQGT